MTIEARFEDPKASRLRVSTDAGATTITIPARIPVLVLLFLFCWLGGWTLGGLAAMRQLLEGPGPTEGRLFLPAWLGAWLAGELAVTGTVLWMLFGREILSASPASLSQTIRVLLYSRTRNYQPSAITNLHWVEAVWSTGGGSNRQPCVAFDYGPKTVTIARGCDAGEGAFVIDTITRRLGLKGRALPKAVEGAA